MRVGEPVRPFRAKSLVFALALSGCIVGAIPAVLLLASPKWLLAYALVAATVAFLSLRTVRPGGPGLPSGSEILLGGAAAVGPAASMSLAVIIIYWTAYGITRLVTWIAGQFGLDWTTTTTIAWWSAVVSALVYGFVVPWMAASRLWRHLFPSAAGIRTPYYQLLRQRRRSVIGGAVSVVIGLVVLLLLIGPDARLFYLWLAIFLAYFGSLLWQVGEEGSRPHRAKPVERAVARLLEVAGFHVVAQPRTGRPDVDPFLMKADYYAERAREGLLVAVKVRGNEASEVGWENATDLVSAAWTMDGAKAELGLSADHVYPVLVLVGRGASESVARLARSSPLRVIHIPDPDGLVQAAMSGADNLDELAREILAPLATEPVESAAQPTEVATRMESGTKGAKSHLTT